MKAREIGEIQGGACLAKAERHGDFNAEAAGAFMLEHLGKWGRSSSELLVNFAKLRGHVPHDDRAFGPVIAGLARKKQIRQVDSCARARGNGTSGGRVWALATPEN